MTLAAALPIQLSLEWGQTRALFPAAPAARRRPSARQMEAAWRAEIAGSRAGWARSSSAGSGRWRRGTLDATPYEMFGPSIEVHVVGHVV